MMLSPPYKMRWLLAIMTFVKTLALGVLFVGCSTFPAAQPNNSGTAPNSLIDLYQGPLNHLSAVRRGPCPMHPSCSEYGRQAMAKHGPVKGWVMAMDRLMRCARDETRLAPKVIVDGQIKFYDPVDKNDFWWANRQPSNKALGVGE